MMPMREIETFLAGPLRNTWLNVGTMSMYVRKGVHQVNGLVINTFDIASVAQEESKRDKGEFWHFIFHLELLLRNYVTVEGIYVESVLNERLNKSLLGVGFTPVDDVVPPSLYRGLR